MLDPVTILEVHDMLKEVHLERYGISVADVRQFVVNHALADCIYVARADDGHLHGAAFGWPIRSAMQYDGAYVNEPDGSIFFCNMLATAERVGRLKADEIIAVLKQHVREVWPDVRYFCYQRAKHGDRMRLYDLERLKHGQ